MEVNDTKLRASVFCIMYSNSIFKWNDRVRWWHLYLLTYKVLILTYSTCACHEHNCHKTVRNKSETAFTVLKSPLVKLIANVKGVYFNITSCINVRHIWESWLVNRKWSWISTLPHPRDRCVTPDLGGGSWIPGESTHPIVLMSPYLMTSFNQWPLITCNHHPYIFSYPLLFKNVNRKHVNCFYLCIHTNSENKTPTDVNWQEAVFLHLYLTIK